QRVPRSVAGGHGRSRRSTGVHAPAVPVLGRRRAHLERRGHGWPGTLLTAEAMDRIEFYKHDLGEVEVASVAQTLRTLFLTLGPRVREFERAFAAHIGCEHVVGVSSCTMGLAMSLEALGIAAGDEVITTPM